MLILGQDPYHGRGQAHGLCFSVPAGVAIPPSLANIHRELADDVGVAVPGHGNLEAWARQGVLLLNATLTVRAGQAGSHQGKGWETFTDEVIAAVNAKPEHVVFVLWGSYARKKRSLIDAAAPHDHRVAASVAAVGAQRLLRQSTVQPRQRRARRPRPATDRLGALMGWPNHPRLRPIRRRSRIADFVLDVLDAYGRHRTGRNASLLAYMGLLTVFPLLLVATTILGLVLENNPTCRTRSSTRSSARSRSSDRRSSRTRASSSAAGWR